MVAPYYDGVVGLVSGQLFGKEGARIAVVMSVRHALLLFFEAVEEITG